MQTHALNSSIKSNPFLRTLACCALVSLATAAQLAPRAHAQDPVPGSFHTTPFPAFNGGSGKITNLSVGAGDDRLNAMAVQSDGKMVLVGSCSNGVNSDFCVARLNVDGTLDTSFDGPSGGNGKFLLPMGTDDDLARAVAIQPDDKIVIAGACASAGGRLNFCVARLHPDGTPDSSFVGPDGTANGAFLLSISSAQYSDSARSITLQTDGKIVVVGSCGGSTGPLYFCLARFNANGSLDGSFNGPGTPGNGKFLLPNNVAFSEYGNDVAVQSDGKIVIVGQCTNVNAPSLSTFCLARLNADGSFDTSFDGPGGAPGNGKFALSISGSYDSGTALALQPDGKIVVVGSCGASPAFCLARLNSDGSLDTRFDGPNGVANGKFLLTKSATTESAYAVALQSDGKIVLAGVCTTASVEAFCVARLNADGSLDASFDGPTGTGGGKFSLSMGGTEDYALGVTLQQDGRIVVAGYCKNASNFDFCVARLNGGPYGAKQCSLDIDGDGKVLATTDMLIGTRVALGMRGSAVIGGISFAAHATRQTWSDIRSYLVNQCGMVIAM
jgi:uncharacterized delta-60 repeat protein